MEKEKKIIEIDKKKAMVDGLKKTALFLLALFASRAILTCNGILGLVLIIAIVIFVFYRIEKKKLKEEKEEEMWRSMGL